ncbi:toll/interleukin-1 receptor domain-containing protein [Pseudofrankia inefficax]|uniref:WD-40 repeat-containing protein n=1 Tax=Pseudofrankia inefficax (strain DSM 45817 / CECT 9037 / DDB 130130 / EuI1c) TaxID=298654 RepID=E3IWI5_PSEI1|nr:toll/interleukin-1 receptor domain-containing protein [Pseudofrankia inefficax]ADP80168.1 WD-40 repeat-containing protein [Pseudofrankia inefficax]
MALDRDHDNGGRDFYISYVAADKEWASWVAWVILQEGNSVEFGEWYPAGTQLPAKRSEGIERASWIIAIVSEEYQLDDFELMVPRNVIQRDPRGHTTKLIPIRVEDCALRRDLQSFVPIDLFGLDKETAILHLHDQIANARRGTSQPVRSPPFPGPASTADDPAADLSPDLSTEPSFPGHASGLEHEKPLSASRPPPSETPLLPPDQAPSPTPPPLSTPSPVVAPPPARAPSVPATQAPAVGVRAGESAGMVVPIPAHGSAVVPTRPRPPLGPAPAAPTGPFVHQQFRGTPVVPARASGPRRVERAVAPPRASTTIRLDTLATIWPGQVRRRSAICAVTFSPDARMLGVVDDHPSVTMWDIADPSAPQLVLAQPLARRPHTGVAFSSDGLLAAAPAAAGGMVVWGLLAGRWALLERATGREPTGDIESLAFAADSDVLVSAGSRGVLVWHVHPSGARDGAVITDPTAIGKQGVGDRVAIDAAGRIVARSARRRREALSRVSLWDVSNLQALVPLRPVDEGEPVTGLAFAGGLLVVGTGDANGAAAHVWRLDDGAPSARRLALLTEGVRPGPLAVRPDGALLAMGRIDVLWELPVGDLPARLREVQRPGGPDVAAMSALAFSPDNRVLAAGTPGGQVILWRIH